MNTTPKVLQIVQRCEALFEDLRASLHWEWIAGHAHPERHFDEAAVREAQSAADLVGYLNYIHPYRVQIVGLREARYLSQAADDDQERRISRIVTLEPPALIIADAQSPPDQTLQGVHQQKRGPRRQQSNANNQPEETGKGEDQIPVRDEQ